MTRARHIMPSMSTQRHERIPELTLGWRLKMALGEQSVQEMAAYLGVSRATLSRWMADKGAPPRRAYLAQWALRTGVSLEWLEKGQAPGRAPDPTPAGDSEELRRLTAAKSRRARGARTTDRYLAPALAA